MAVHLTSCTTPHAPLVCAASFMYGRERATLVASSDEDCEADSPDGSVCDEDENEDEEREAPASSASPKQLMTVRERMLEFVQSSSPAKTSARVIVVQVSLNFETSSTFLFSHTPLSILFLSALLMFL